MANKFAAVFLVCIVVVATSVHASEPNLDELFRKCFNECSDQCKTNGHGDTHCEMKCDADCMAKESKARLDHAR